MTDLRKAAEMALEALESYQLPFQAPIREALRQALAQPEQKPVAWLIQYKTRHDIVWGSAPGLRSSDQILGMEPLYTAPPKREWVGYTNEDRERIVPVLVQSLLNHDEKTMARLMKAILIDIEDKLKEKNT